MELIQHNESQSVESLGENVREALYVIADNDGHTSDRLDLTDKWRASRLPVKPLADLAAGTRGLYRRIDRTHNACTAGARTSDTPRSCGHARYDNDHRGVCLSPGMADTYSVGSYAAGASGARPGEIIDRLADSTTHAR